MVLWKVPKGTPPQCCLKRPLVADPGYLSTWWGCQIIIWKTLPRAIVSVWIIPRSLHVNITYWLRKESRLRLSHSALTPIVPFRPHSDCLILPLLPLTHPPSLRLSHSTLTPIVQFRPHLVIFVDFRRAYFHYMNKIGKNSSDIAILLDVWPYFCLMIYPRYDLLDIRQLYLSTRHFYPGYQTTIPQY